MHQNVFELIQGAKRLGKVRPTDRLAMLVVDEPNDFVDSLLVCQELAAQLSRTAAAADDEDSSCPVETLPLHNDTAKDACARIGREGHKPEISHAVQTEGAAVAR